MSAFAHPARASSAGVRMLLCLLLLALGLRALVPVGYMPDAQALHDGRIQITFCSSAGGAPTLLQVLAQAPGQSQVHDHGGGHGAADPAQDGAQECPFWMAVHQALDVPPPQPAVLPVAGLQPISVPAPALRTLPPLPAAGPALGPRGPPVFLA